ncbi:MAG: hypothetical protein AB1806_04105 [Acidobacteriota bacterium]
MVTILSLWLPILLAAVIVFVASSIIHMVLPYHKGDMKKVPRQDDVQDALRPFDIPPGDYMLPMCDSMKEMGAPSFQDKMRKGPVAIMTVLPSKPVSMGPSLVMWFVYCIVVSVFAAYIAGRALQSGADYLAVFRFAGCTAFLGYGLAQVQNSIWYSRAWSTTIKHLFDALVYGLLTAGTFGWLWPR